MPWKQYNILPYRCMKVNVWRVSPGCWESGIEAALTTLLAVWCHRLPWQLVRRAHTVAGLSDFGLPSAISYITSMPATPGHG